jgi:hypothetical protein
VWEEKDKLFAKRHRDREAYLYYPPGFGADQGDLMVRFDGEAEAKKYWGMKQR